MHIIKHGKNLIEFNYPTQYDLCSSFIRLQEFYESPHPDINGRFFTLDYFMDLYASRNKKNQFTYFTDWAGFNLPGNAVLNFFKTFSKSPLRDKESDIEFHLSEFLNNDSPDFYVIGTYGDSKDNTTLLHELAHAYYYLSPEYKESCDEITKTLSPEVYQKIRKYLMSIGYSDAVVPDEIQAYLSTDDTAFLAKRFKVLPVDIANQVLQFSHNYKTNSLLYLT